MRVFERWLKSQGITPLTDKGKGSHRRFEYAGRWEGYGTSGGNDRLVLNDAKRLYKFFGYQTVADFQIAVATKAALPG